MKDFKWLWLLPVAIFPYTIWVVGSMVEAIGIVLPNFSPVVLLLLFWLLGLAGAGIVLWQSFRGNWEGRKLALAGMIIKLFHIQNYIVLFFGAIFLFMIPLVTVVIWVFDVMSITLSGLVGLAAVLRCRVEGRLTNKAAIVNGILQFVFCADVISVIWVYRNTKEAFLS